jgi:hypothetical protein
MAITASHLTGIETDLQYRKGNRALDHLVADYSHRNSEVAVLVEMLPKLSTELCREAKDAALFYSAGRRGNVIAGCFGVFRDVYSGRQKLLEHCIIDLMLYLYFLEVCRYCGDKEAALAFVDALLYQATGCEPRVPSQLEIRDEGTHKARGLSKYVLAHQEMRKIGDIMAWVLGKEFAALEGSPNHFAVILSVSPFSFMVRARAKWTIRHALYGIAPTEAEEKELAEMIAKQNKELLDIFKGQQR